eukprot:scaffold229164_cov27-Tisochrysis_lutea.AAC.2
MQHELLIGVAGVDGSALCEHRLILEAADWKALPYSGNCARSRVRCIPKGSEVAHAKGSSASSEENLSHRGGLIVLQQQRDCAEEDTLAEERKKGGAEEVQGIQAFLLAARADDGREGLSGSHLVKGVAKAKCREESVNRLQGLVGRLGVVDEAQHKIGNDKPEPRDEMKGDQSNETS